MCIFHLIFTLSLVHIMILIYLFACAAPPPQAPENLEDLCKFIFARVDAEDEGELQAGLVNLYEWLNTDDNLEQSRERSGGSLGNKGVEAAAAAILSCARRGRGVEGNLARPG